MSVERRTNVRWKFWLVVAGVAAVLFACTEPLVLEPVQVETVSVAGPSRSITAGDSVGTVTVTVKDQAGRAVPNRTVTLQTAGGRGSVTPASAATDADGVVSARWTVGVKAGIDSLVASTGGKDGDLVETVVASTAKSLRLKRDTVTFTAEGDSVQLSVDSLTDAFGNTTFGTPAYAVVDTGIVRTTTSGYVIAKRPGATRVIASVGVAVDTVRITVAPVAVSLSASPGRARLISVGDSLQIAVAMKDRNANKLDAATGATLQSSNPSVAAVIGTSGWVKAVAAGRAKITVTAGQLSDSAWVFVGAPVATTVRIAPHADTVYSTSRTVPLAATVLDQDTLAIANAPVTWTSLDSGVATVASDGKTLSRLGGSARIVATSAGAAPDTAVVVVQQVLASIAVAPSTFKIAVGDTIQIVATALDSAATAIPGLAVSYASSAPATAVVLPDGRTIGQANGSVTITAQMAQGTVTRQRNVAGVVANVVRWSMLSSGVGSNLTCGVTTTGAGYCWGGSGSGALGTGDLNYSPTARPILGSIAWQSVQVGGGGDFTCGLTTAGKAYCWGRDDFGQLGTATTSSTCGAQALPCALAPAPVSGNFSFKQITVGDAHACGLDSGGTAYCWGNNRGGQLGIPIATVADSQRAAPAAVQTTLKFSSLSAGWFGTCGIATNGLTYCWGLDNWWGVDGNGTRNGTATPGTPISDVTLTSVSAPHSWLGSVCGLTAGGAAYCWGDNELGTLGSGVADTSKHPAPVAVAGGLTFTQLASSPNHVCGLTTGGQIYCWGGGRGGALGGGSVPPASCTGGTGIPVYAYACSPTPVLVSGGHTFKYVSTSSWGEYSNPGPTAQVSCGITTAGDAWCWGFAPLGDGGAAYVITPTPVQVLSP